jgi:hypothetical protein
MLDKYITFVKAHEKLLIVGLAGLLLFKTGQGIENMWIRHDDHVAQQAAIQVTTDTTSNKALADILAASKANQDAAFAKINQSIAQAEADLKKQQAVDSIATQQQILDRWKLLLPLKPGAVQSNGSTDTITTEAATQTVQALEKIPVLELQVSDLNAKLLIDDGIIGKQDDLITGLNKQIVDEKASHVADVNLEKAKAKRSWFRGFKIGVIVSAVGTEAIRVWVGHP